MSEQCECSKKVHDKILDAVKSKFPDQLEYGVTLLGYGLFENKGDLSYKPKMDVEYYYDHHAKNGDMKRKKTKTFVVFTFCPFCGKEIV